MASTISDSLAIARAQVDHVVEDDISSDNEPLNVISSNIVADYAFAFDIDGVLLKGGKVIPEAKQAMRVLNGENTDGLKVPYIFVTNVGVKNPSYGKCS